jgi:serine/threonine protein kinase
MERVLGTGSFATVWLAVDEVLERQVAVKVLADNWSQDHDVRRRFLVEARVLLTVESPRIVRGFHIGETPTGQPYLVMAYADRGTLGDRIDQRRREGRTFDAGEAVGIAAEIAYALADVHASGHLHRDVKPSNVLIRSSPGRPQIPGLATDESIVLGDFGLARGLELTALTLVAGSPGYVAPEQAAGLTQLDRRADLYPLGRILLELLTGDAGGTATTMQGAAAEDVDVARLHDRATRPPERTLAELVARLVARNPEDRPGSADEVAATLVGIGGALAHQASEAAPPPLPPPVREPSSDGGGRRRVAVAAGAALAAVAAIIGLVVAFAGDDGGSGGGDSTTTAPAVPPPGTADAETTVPETTEAGTTTSETTVPETTALDTTAPGTTVPESTVPDTTAPESTVPETTAPETTAPESTAAPTSAPAEPARLTLPEGAFTPDVLSTAAPDPDLQEGAMLMAADEFAGALVAANPDWTGQPAPAAADGTVDFELRGFGRTAAVHVEPAAESTGAVIVAFTIEYT